MIKTYHFGSLKSVISDAELERRWKAVRQGMNKEGVDCLLLYGNDAWCGGGVKWFTDFPCENTYGLVLLFPKEGEMAVYGHGYTGGTAIPDFAARGVGFNFGYPLAPVFGYTDNFIPEEALKFLQKRDYKKIGLYRKTMTPYNYVQYLREHLPKVEFVDADDIVDTVKAVKSEEELTAMKESVRIHDVIHAALPLWLRPGRLERDVTMDIRKAALDMGCEEMNIMIGASKKRSYHVPIYLQNEVIEPGSNVEIVLEFTGTGGYYAELQRIWCVDCEPSPALRRAMNSSFELQAILAKNARPGVPASTMRTLLLEYQESNGFEKENRLQGHGQGVDLVERPSFVFGENMKFAENMFISIHPACGDRDAYCNACDNFLVTKDGAVRLSKTEQKIFMI
ncbi:MAG: M24 family metallopeptidase [Gracilibacteraceae bacterium]|jgi:Xaa-Pro aminopeptidase|nr:M24 family metallopeptidase [Gracilibacteraceae bacterium]